MLDVTASIDLRNATCTSLIANAQHRFPHTYRNRYNPNSRARFVTNRVLANAG
jgi:hypothetical protein